MAKFGILLAEFIESLLIALLIIIIIYERWKVDTLFRERTHTTWSIFHNKRVM